MKKLHKDGGVPAGLSESVLQDASVRPKIQEESRRLRNIVESGLQPHEKDYMRENLTERERQLIGLRPVEEQFSTLKEDSVEETIIDFIFEQAAYHQFR